jgi:hypothetical protein
VDHSDNWTRPTRAIKKDAAANISITLLTVLSTTLNIAKTTQTKS